jgi:ligand-binding sensor domain-containing protein
MQPSIKLLITLVFLVSCKTEHQKANPSNGREGPVPESGPSVVATTKSDTVFSSEAPGRITRNIKLDKNGRLLMAAYDDIVIYDGVSFSHLRKEEGLDSWYAFDVLEDREGNIWIASDQSGAYRVDPTGVITNFNTEDGLGHRRNMCVYEDRAGNIWIGGQGGLSRYDGSEFTNFTTEDGLPHNDVNTILEDKSGNIWIGTRGNAGLFDGSTFSELTNDQGKPFFNVWSIMEDRAGDIWLVDSTGLWKYSKGKFTYELSEVWKIYEDRNYDFWLTGMLGAGGSKLIKLNTDALNERELVSIEIFQSGKMLFGMQEDLKGNLWIGGGDGVWSYDGEKPTYYTGILRPDN